uniref:Uncharacterized protein n=1 Tax=Anguilla anguilla TaxID=7936 RepID=A0A0E9TWQ0_ANGAN
MSCFFSRPCTSRFLLVRWVLIIVFKVVAILTAD